MTFGHLSGHLSANWEPRPLFFEDLRETRVHIREADWLIAQTVIKTGQAHKKHKTQTADGMPNYTLAPS